MAKVLVPYCPAYGHVETMALAVADGARKAGGHVDVKRAPELVPEEVRGAPTSNLIRARRSLGSSTSLGHAASD